MMQFSKSVENMQPSDIREIGKLTADPEIISFAGGMPDPGFFPIEALRKASDLVLQEDGKTALQYNATAGYLPLREKISKRMTNMGIQVSAESILLTSGSQQGIDFCGKVFLNEGDAIICESPSYSGALNAFSAYLPEFIEIPTDDQGMDIEALNIVLASKNRVKFIYVIPDFQNPTGRSWSLERRQKLIVLANKFNIPVIEDDPYSSFRFEGNALPTLKSLDSENNVIYLGTFSKMLCPGLRVGWIVCRKEILNKIEIVKQVADIHSNSLTQREVAKYLDLYNLDDQIKSITEAYKKRRDIMLNSIKEFFPSACHHTKPDGGIFIWVELPESLNAREILLEAVKEKVAFIPGGGFFPNSKKENTIRLSFATMPDAKIKEGVKRLGKVLKRSLTK
jgi:2-aminoadipate transaminase